jgi:hypothetical protein
MRVAVIISFRGDQRLLAWTLEGYAGQRLAPGHSLEVRVGWDGGTPGGGADMEMEGTGAVRMYQRTFDQMGAAGVRNALVGEADADLIIFGNADARPEPDMVQRHIEAMAGAPAGSMVLGEAPWEMPAQPTVWNVLLAETPMVFFYHQLKAGEWYDFRQSWTLNLSIRREDFKACGGFPEEIRPVYFEDLALGYRLLGKERKGILYEPRARVLHRHPTSLDQYLDREELLGIMSPVLARNCPGAFGVLHGTRDLEALTRSFREWVRMDAPMHRWIYQRMQAWTGVPAETLGTGAARERLLMRLYQMHVPLKRLAFRLGFLKGMKLAEDSRWLERKTEGLWRSVLA